MISRQFKYRSIIESETQMYIDVKAFLEQSGVTGRFLYRIMLSVSEGFTNALEHGNQYDPAKNIEINISINDGTVNADIIDEGNGNTGALEKRGQALPMHEGGRGIDLIEYYAEKVELIKNRRTGGLELSLRFIESAKRDREKIVGINGGRDGV